jgi:hypothetical protein
MGRWVARANWSVKAPPYHLPIAHHHCSDRNFINCIGLRREIQGKPHEDFVAH